MKLSLWNQHWEHEEVIGISPKDAYDGLVQYYRQSSKSFTLDKEAPPGQFSFQRGNVVVSALGLGSELWCKHHVDVDIRDAEDGKAHISWTINMKLFGLQAGKNAIVEECKRIVKQIA